MNDIKFNCPQCGQHLAVDATGAGLTVTCPKCGTSILVPQLARLAASPAPPRRAKWWLWSLAGVIIAVIVLAGVGLLVIRKPNGTETRSYLSKPAAAGKSAVSPDSTTNAIMESQSHLPLLYMNFEAAKSMHYDEASLRFHIRGAGYNQLYVELRNVNDGDKESSPKDFAFNFAFKFGFDAQSHDLGIEFRAGDGIDEKTGLNIHDQYGGALTIPVSASLETRKLISGMTEADQQVLAGILQNASRIVKDTVENSEKLSAEDRAFWITNSVLFDLKARQLIEALQSPAWNPGGFSAKHRSKISTDKIKHFILHKAAYEGDLEEVKALVASGADVNARWPKDNNFTPLLFAVTKGHENLRGIFDTSGFKKINELKDRTKNVDYPRQYAEIVSLLLANGADINAKAPNGETPLLVSLQFDCSDMAKLLIAKGADVNAKDNQGTTPLFSATLGNDKDMENLLMAKGAKVDIFTASAMGDIERVQGFLNSNPGMITATQGVLTPFHVAAYSGQTEMMKFLLGKGVDVNAGYPERITPLFLAANNGHLDAAELLIAKGAIINSESTNSQSPLFGAAWRGNKAIGELLIAKGADVNAKNDTGWAPLFAAAMTSKGGNDMVELLIAKGANVNAKDKDGRTPLWASVNRNHLERAKLLVSKGADINAKKNDGLTALDIAARFAHKDFAEFLITNGADIRAIGDTGWTPLHYAAYGGNKDIVEMLLAKGADANARDKDGKTPDIVARDEGYADIAELIKKH